MLQISQGFDSPYLATPAHICEPFQWVYYGYNDAMYQQVSNAGVEYKHWNLRGDLVATSSPTGAYSPAPITDAFGDLVAGARQTYDWNGAWGMAFRVRV